MHRRLLVLALLLAAAARADVLRLRNGGILVGKVVAQTDKEVVFRTSTSEIRVPREQVASIEESEAPLDVYTRRAAELPEGDANAHYALAQYCIQNRLTQQAIAQLRQTLALQADHEQARAKLREILDPQAAALLASGKESQAKGEWVEAEAPLTRLLELYPESTHAAEAHHYLAKGYAARHEYDQALVRWRRALNLWPGFAEACEGAAAACIELGDWQEALRFTERALDIRKDGPEATRLRGRADAIRQLMQLSASRDPKAAKPEELAQEGELLRRLGLEERGIERLEAAFQAGARDPELLGFLADHYERRGRVRQALRVCEALSAAGAQSNELLRRRARLQRLLLIPKALATRDKAERRRILYEIAKSGVSFQYLEAALRESTVRGPREGGRPTEGSFMVEESLIKADCACYVPEGYDPNRPWPLLLAFHRDGDNGKDHFYNWENAAKSGRWLVLCPTAPNEDREWKFDDLPLVASALRYAMRLYHVDTNRVYVAGTGSGALMAWAVALRHPDLFAALVVRNGKLDEISRMYLPAAINLPVYQLVSERMSPEVIGSLREAESALSRWNYASRHEEVPGGRHPAMPELNAKVGQWLEDKVRNPYTPRVRLVSFEYSNAECFWVRIDRFADTVFDPDRKIDSAGPLGIRFTEEQLRQFYLARMNETLASVTAHVSPGNRIRVAAKHVGELTVSLDDQIVDLDKPVLIYVNGELAFRDKVERSLEYLFESARRHEDPRMCYAAKVTLKVE